MCSFHCHKSETLVQDRHEQSVSCSKCFSAEEITVHTGYEVGPVETMPESSEGGSRGSGREFVILTCNKTANKNMKMSS